MLIRPLVLLACLGIPLMATVVRPAPGFFWESFNGKSASLSSIGKQPAILIIAPSPHSGAFKKQLHEVEGLYRQYAGRGTLFFAAFTKEPGVIRSNIPFLYVQNPVAVAQDYGVEKDRFQVVVIGPDRNIDLLSNNVTVAERLRDVIDNSEPQQSVRRAGQ